MPSLQVPFYALFLPTATLQTLTLNFELINTNTFLALPKEGVAKKSRWEQFFLCARLPLPNQDATASRSTSEVSAGSVSVGTDQDAPLYTSRIAGLPVSCGQKDERRYRKTS